MKKLKTFKETKEFIANWIDELKQIEEEYQDNDNTESFEYDRLQAEIGMLDVILKKME